MKNQELWDRSLKTLVNAYLNGTLVHGSQCGCAVGNLIYRPGSKHEIKKLESVYSNINWYSYAVCGNGNRHGALEIQNSGYSISEILKIEKAFEKYPESNFKDDNDGYLGLMSVVDALMLIHEATPQQAQSAKELFTLAHVG